MLRESASQHANLWLKGVLSRIYYASRHPLFKSPIKPIGFVMDFWGFSLSLLNLILLLIGILIGYYVFVKKRLPWFTALLFMIVASNMIVAYIGAQDEWSRLNVPVVTLSVILCVQAVTFLVKRRELELP